MITNLHLKYGQALYKTAQKQQADERVLADLESAAGLFQDRELKNLMGKIAFLPYETLQKVLTSTFHGKIHQLVLNLMIMLGNDKALALLPKVFEIYRKIYNEQKGIQEVTLRSARPLSEDQRSALTDSLQKKSRKPLAVRFEEDPALIAGVQIYENGYLSDYSIQNYLHTLRHNLLQEPRS